MSYCLPCSPDKRATPHSAEPFSHALGPVLYECGCTQILQIKKHKKDVGNITNESIEDTGSNPEAKIVFLDPKKRGQFFRVSERNLLLPPSGYTVAASQILLWGVYIAQVLWQLWIHHCWGKITASRLQTSISLSWNWCNFFVPTVLFLSKTTGFYQSANSSQQETNIDIQHSFSFSGKRKLHLQPQNCHLKNKPKKFVYC